MWTMDERPDVTAITFWAFAFRYASRAHQPAIHIERLPGHEGRVVAGEKRDRARKVCRHLTARDRLARGRDGKRALHVGFARARPTRHGARRPHERRRDRVDGHAV